jgi:hypothetical protein
MFSLWWLLHAVKSILISLLMVANIHNLFTESLPDNWNDVSEMVQLRPLDRSFLFPGICFFPATSVQMSGAIASYL